jgi:hypothetical protein
MAGPTTYVTKFPAASTYTFGSTDETGISVESYEQNDQTDTFEQKNGVGEVIEVVTHNPRGEVTLTGEMNAALTQVLGTSMTLTNLVKEQYGTGALGIFICKGVNHSKGRAKNMAVRLTGTYYPLVSA